LRLPGDSGAEGRIASDRTHSPVTRPELWGSVAHACKLLRIRVNCLILRVIRLSFDDIYSAFAKRCERARNDLDADAR